LEDKVTSQPPNPFVFQPPPNEVYTAIPTLQANNRMKHALIAWGEQTYKAVPIPGAYADLASYVILQQVFGLA
jgi:hypothetical protein